MKLRKARNKRAAQLVNGLLLPLMAEHEFFNSYPHEPGTIVVTARSRSLAIASGR